jgi:hypothetical protein
MDDFESTSYMMRSLLGSTADPALADDDCFCIPHFNHGTPAETMMLKVMLWINFAVCAFLLAYYCYDYYKATCGWEEVYVCIIEGKSCQCMLQTSQQVQAHLRICTAAVAVLLDIFAEEISPVTLTLSNGIHVNMVRYSLWILTCPVGYVPSKFCAAFSIAFINLGTNIRS